MMGAGARLGAAAAVVVLWTTAVAFLGARICFSCLRLCVLVAGRLSCCGRSLFASGRLVQLMVLAGAVQCVGAVDPCGESGAKISLWFLL